MCPVRRAQQSCGPNALSGKVQSSQIAATSSLSGEELNKCKAPRSSGNTFGAMPATTENASVTSEQLCSSSAILARLVARFERLVSSRTMRSFCRFSSGCARARSHISDCNRVLASMSAAVCWRICSSDNCWLRIWSSMSAQAPNHFTMTPSESRIGVARTRCQRKPPAALRRRYSISIDSPVWRHFSQFSRATGRSSGWRALGQPHPKVCASVNPVS